MGCSTITYINFYIYIYRYVYLYHYQSIRLVLATATSRIEVIRIGGNRVATERAAYLAPAITDKQTKGGRCEGPCVIMNYYNNYDQHHPSCCHRCAEGSQPRCCRSRRTHCRFVLARLSRRCNRVLAHCVVQNDGRLVCFSDNECGQRNSSADHGLVKAVAVRVLRTGD